VPNIRTQALASLSRTWLRLSLSKRFREPLDVGPDRSVLFVSNHCCSLDSALAIDILEGCDRDWVIQARPSMLSKFGWLYAGRYASTGDSAVERTRALRGLKDHLRRPMSAVWVYPEGDHNVSWGGLPARSGLNSLLSAVNSAESLVVAVGISYVQFRASRPAAIVGFEVFNSERSVTASDVSDAIGIILGRVEVWESEMRDTVRKTFGS